MGEFRSLDGETRGILGNREGFATPSRRRERGDRGKAWWGQGLRGGIRFGIEALLEGGLSQKSCREANRWTPVPDRVIMAILPIEPGSRVWGTPLRWLLGSPCLERIE